MKGKFSIRFYYLYNSCIILLLTNYLFSEYWKKTENRLPAMLISIHYLLHVADSILATGPCWSTWQFPMERLCGMLLPLAHSKSSPYKNIANNIILYERLNHLKYLPQFYSTIFPTAQDVKDYAEDKIYISKDEDIEFRWPSQKYTLSKVEIRKLKECYRTMFEFESLSEIKVHI